MKTTMKLEEVTRRWAEGPAYSNFLFSNSLAQKPTCCLHAGFNAMPSMKTTTIVEDVTRRWAEGPANLRTRLTPHSIRGNISKA